MSKAMDALELVWRIMCDGGDTDIEACAAACALLRDYITTTEAVGEVPDDVGALLDKLRGIWKTDEDGDGALLIAFIAKRETAWAIALAGEQLAHETDLTQSAARIKELEEALGEKDAALRVAQKGMNQRRIFGYNLDKGHLSSLWDAEDAQVKAALDGARKAGPC